MASIEFLVDGTIVTANENFPRLMGYSIEEIKGTPSSHVRRHRRCALL
jgi:PAS domain-containing protein